MSEDTTHVDGLLHAREARGLRLPVITRLVMAAAGLVVVAWGPQAARQAILVFTVVTLVANVWFLVLLRDARHVRLVGVAGALIDVTLQAFMAYAWYRHMGGGELSPLFISKTPYTAITLMVIAINGLALRPLYPLIVAAGTTAVHIGLLAFGLADPRTVFSDSVAEIFAGPATTAVLPVYQIVFVVLVGAIVTFITRIARQTVRQAIALQVERAQLERERARAVMEARVGALGKLVAGISHEMNTPMGALKSCANTANHAVARLKDLGVGARDIEEQKKRFGDTVTRLEQSTQTAMEASGRLAETLATLRGFAQLDEADFQRLDINDGLEQAVSLVPEERRASAKVLKDYGELPATHGYLSRMRQVFATVLINAFEAIAADGTVMLRTWREGDEVCVRVADNGKGIPPERLAGLFDVQFGAKSSSRVGAGLGLAACRNVMLQHGGNISADSDVGQGTVITITVPIR